MESKILHQIFRIDQSARAALTDGAELGPTARQLAELHAVLSDLKSRGDMTAALAKASAGVSNRIETLANAIVELGRMEEEAVSILGAKVEDLRLGSTAMKRIAYHTISSERPSKLPRRPLESQTAQAGRAFAHSDGPTSDLRFWFLGHLSSPYPTANEKSALASKMACSRNKIESDLTNWRRRCGWTEMMHNYAGGKRDLMASLVERIESILNDRDVDDFDPRMEQRRIRKVATECGLSVKDMDEAVKAVEKMKKYLTREEEERVGDWVHEIANLTGKKSLQAYVKPPVTHARGASTGAHARLRESTECEDANTDAVHLDVHVEGENIQDAAQGDAASDPQDRTISNQTSMTSLAAASDVACGQLRNVSGSSGFSVATGSEASFCLGSMSPETPLRTRAVDRYRARSGRANGNARSSSTATPTSGTFSFVPVIAPTFSASQMAFTPPVRDELVMLPVKRDSSEEAEEDDDDHSDRSDHRKMPRLDTATSRASRASFSSQPTFADAHHSIFDYTERYGFGPASDCGSHHSAYPVLPPAPVPELNQYPQHGFQQQVIYYDPRHPPIMRALPSVDTPHPAHFSSAASSHSGSSDFDSQGPWNQYPALPMLPHMQMQPPTQPANGLPEQWEFRPYQPAA